MIKNHSSLANAVAERLGAHIESLRQYDQTQSALALSEKLFDSSRSLTQATDLQELVAGCCYNTRYPSSKPSCPGNFGLFFNR